MNQEITLNLPRYFPVRRIPLVRTFIGFCIFAAAVLVPLLTFGIEISTRICSMVLVNPVPSFFHVLAVLSVPLINFCTLLYLRRKYKNFPKALSLFQGIAISIATVYSILFLPVIPTIGLMLLWSATALFIPAFLTLLPSAPFLSLAGAVIYRNRSSKYFNSIGVRTTPVFILGSVLGALFMCAIEAPRTLTRIKIEQLVENPHDAATLRSLRSYGDEAVLLKAAYGELSNHSDFVGWITNAATKGGSIFRADRLEHLQFIDQNRAQQIYYQVTGKTYRSVPSPTSSMWSDAPIWSTFFDQHMGQQKMGGRAEGLSLIGSQIDSSIDANGLVAYSEWIMVLKNTSEREQEARAEVTLPPGATVSRATLWINGEEREASFDSREKTIAAYQSVVQRRRDPLLVSYISPNKIIVQCFPVMPHGGEMKIRLGVSTPLSPRTLGQASFNFPYISDSNFAAAPKTQHALWVESKTALSIDGGSGLNSEHSAENVYALRGSIDAQGDRLAHLLVTASRDNNIRRAFNVDQNDGKIVLQDLHAQKSPSYRDVVLVVDGSGAMAPYADAIADAVGKLGAEPGASPKGVATIIAGDTVVYAMDHFVNNTPQALAEISHTLSRYNYAGGANNLSALVAAWDIAAQSNNSIILWLHGPQPEAFSAVDELNARYFRRPNGPKIVSIPLLSGPNKLLESKDTAKFTHEVALSQVTLSAPNFLENLLNAHESFQVTRTKLGEPIPTGASDLHRTSVHLTNLWAADYVRNLLMQGKSDATQQAGQIAKSHRIVSEVSGAVVLESAAQYAAAGLENPQATLPHVPAIPEPTTYAMTIITLLMLVTFYRRREVA